MKKRHLTRWLPVFLFAVGVPVSTERALTQPSIIRGCLVDASGAAITSARISAGHRIALPDRQGCFSIAAGDRASDLAIRAEGFSEFRRDDIAPGTDLGQIQLQLDRIATAVVVTATRTAVSAGNVGDAVDVITRNDIDASQARSVPEVLRTAAGIQVTKTGVSGGLTTLFTRGGESDYTKVLVDGIPVNQPGGTYDISHLPTGAIERIEVVKGPQSANFGSDAMSGVIQIFTRRGSGPPEVDYRIEGGSFGTLEQSAGIRGGWKRFDYANTFTRFDTDNVVRNNDYRNASNFGSASYAMTDRQYVRGTYFRTAVHAGSPGATSPGFTSFGPNDRMVRTENAGSLTYGGQLNDTFTHEAAYRAYDLDQTFRSAFGTSRVSARRHRGEYHATLGLPALSLSFGGDLDAESGIVGGKRRSRNNRGAFLQVQTRLANRVFLTVGARVERNPSFGTAASPRFSLSYTLRQGGSDRIGATRMRFAAGSGIKEPSLIENYSESSFFLGNSRLEAERSRSVEAGIEQSLLADRITVDAAWFDNRYRNLIELIRRSPALSQYDNIGRTVSHGVELRAKGRTRFVHVNAGYTFLEGGIRESRQPSFPFRPGDPLLRRPRHNAHMGFTFMGRQWTGSWTTRWVGQRADSDFFTAPAPVRSNEGYTLSNVAGTFRIRPWVELQVRVDNIADRRYQEVIGYEALGRSVVVGTRVRLGRSQ